MAGIFNRFEWQIAGRYIRSRRREGVISLIAWASFLGIMIGVATLIIVMAVMNGFRADLLERILGVGGHAVVRPYGGAFQSQKEVVDRLVQLDGVQRVTPVLEAQVMVSVGTTARGAILRGVDKALIPQLPVLTDNKVLGDLSRVGEIENTTSRHSYWSAHGGNLWAGNRYAAITNSTKRSKNAFWYSTACPPIFRGEYF